METVRMESGRMTAERRSSSSFWNIKSILILVWCLLIASLVGLATAAQIGIDSVSGVMPQVTVGGYSIAGNGYNEVLESMNLIAARIEEQTIVLTGQNGESYRYSAKQLGVKADPEAMAKEAYGIGRSDNLLENVWNYWRLKLIPREISSNITIDEAKLSGVLNELAKKITMKKIDGGYTASGVEVTFTEGRDGVTLHKDESKAAILSALGQIRYPGSEIQEIVVPLAVSTEKGKKLNLEQMAAALYREPKDAGWIKDENGKLALKPHVDGTKLNVDLAGIKLKRAKGNPVTMPLTVIKPEKTTESLQASLLSDVLATYTTTLAVNPDRTHNVALAAEKINGLVLMPGEVFSFNNIVGPRTYETGFKDAKIYVKDEIVDGVGGGICQVTSTLYMTTLMADLQTVQRRNHRFSVAYIPLGYDATVAYGTIDFQFANNQDYPIQIEANVKGQKLTITLLGTITQPGKTVELTTKTYNPKPFGTKQKVSETLAPGATKVEQKGSMGYSVDTFKTVKVGDVVISSEKIHTSVYTPLDEIILVGPAAEPDPAVPADPAAPSDPFGPVDPSVPTDPTVPTDPAAPEGPEPPAQLPPSYIIDPWLIG